MPAAAWAARSGDPILFAARDARPDATLEALERHEEVPVYVLGPKAAISQGARGDSRRRRRRSRRMGGEDPVESAIEFARFVDGAFGWNINDPGHGFVIANTDPARSTPPPRRRSRRAAPGARCCHRRRRRAAGGAAGLPARHQAGLRGRPDPRRLQPPLADRRRERDLGRRPGADGRAGELAQVAAAPAATLGPAPGSEPEATRRGTATTGSSGGGPERRRRPAAGRPGPDGGAER